MRLQKDEAGTGTHKHRVALSAGTFTSISSADSLNPCHAAGQQKGSTLRSAAEEEQGIGTETRAT